MEKEIQKKYFDLIVTMVKAHPRYSGLEAILDDIVQDVYEHSKIILDTVTNEEVINSYINKVIATSIITVPKKMNFNKRVSHRVITTQPVETINKTAETVVTVEPIVEEVETKTVIVEPEPIRQEVDKTLVEKMINGYSAPIEPQEENSIEFNLEEELEELEIEQDNILDEEVTTEVEAEQEDEIFEELSLETETIEAEVEEEPTESLEVYIEETLEETSEVLELSDEVDEVEEVEEVEEQESEVLEEIETIEQASIENLEEEEEEESFENNEEFSLTDNNIEEVETLEETSLSLEEVEEEFEATDLLIEEPTEISELPEVQEVENDTVEDNTVDDTILPEASFRKTDYSNFDFQPEDRVIDTDGIIEAIEDLAKKNPESNVDKIYEMKFISKKSVLEISEELGMIPTFVLETLHEITDLVKD